jgi:hypothetical protein
MPSPAVRTWPVGDVTHPPPTTPRTTEVIDGGDRVGRGPQADLARVIAGVAMIQHALAIERGLDVIAHRDDP